VRVPKKGRAWCSHRAKNEMGPSTTWLIRQLAPPWHSVGNAVSSLGSPSYPAVESNIARRNRPGVFRVPGVSVSMPNAVKISPM
jgi:hypothetical protein